MNWVWIKAVLALTAASFPLYETWVVPHSRQPCLWFEGREKKNKNKTTSLHHTQSKCSPFRKKLIHMNPRLPLFWWSRISPLLYNNNVFHLLFFCTLRVADIKSAVPIISGSLFFKHFPSPGFSSSLFRRQAVFFVLFLLLFFITFLSRFPFNSTLYLQNQKGLVMLAKLDWEPKKKKKKKKKYNLSFKTHFPLLRPGNLSRLRYMHLFHIS